jgi:hypothetical protein
MMMIGLPYSIAVRIEPMPAWLIMIVAVQLEFLEGLGPQERERPSASAARIGRGTDLRDHVGSPGGDRPVVDRAHQPVEWKLGAYGQQYQITDPKHCTSG